MEYTNDIYNKFSTPLIRYSNYKEDINVENEILSLSQIAPQILSDAEICHRSYFDFLLALRSEYPIIHQEFPIKKGSMLDLYESVQYDILFGEQYLLK